MVDSVTSAQKNYCASLNVKSLCVAPCQLQLRQTQGRLGLGLSLTPGFVQQVQKDCLLQVKFSNLEFAPLRLQTAGVVCARQSHDAGAFLILQLGWTHIT